MPLAIRVQFLAGYTGREWPPSPARLFKALVSSARMGWASSKRKKIEEALRKLEQQGWTGYTKLPEISAPRATLRPSRQRRFVPNNSRNWPTERKLNPKKSIDLEPEPMVGWDIEPPSIVWYWWPNFDASFVNVIREVSRRVVSVGKGEDFALLDAFPHLPQELPPVRWKPAPSGVSLEVPEAGCLAVCDDFFTRAAKNELPLPAAGVRAVTYASDAYGADQEIPTFVLGLWRKGKRCSWDARLLQQVIDPVRHLLCDEIQREVVDSLARCSSEVPAMETLVRRVLLGQNEHGHPICESHLAILPLPSVLGPYPDGRVRRIALTDLGRGKDPNRRAIVELAHVLLHGRELRDNNKQGIGVILETEPDGQWLRAITKPSRVWSTVTPLVQPAKELTSKEWQCLVEARRNAEQQPAKAVAYEIYLRKRRLELLNRSVQQAIEGTGAQVKSIEFTKSGWIAGVHVATQYRANGYLGETPKLHVRVTFDKAIAGPIAIGRGRHVGFGVLWPEGE